MQLEDGALVLTLNEVAALVDVRAKKKGAPLAMRVWLADVGRGVLYVTGESMVVRGVVDLVDALENDSNLVILDPAQLWEIKKNHMKKGFTLRIHADHVAVHDDVGTHLFDQDCRAKDPNFGPVTAMLALETRLCGGTYTKSDFTDLHPGLLAILAKVAKGVGSTSARFGVYPGVDTDDAVRVELPTTGGGFWAAAMMPSRIKEKN